MSSSSGGSRKCMPIAACSARRSAAEISHHPLNDMPRLLVLGYTISLDGYGAGPRQSREEPLGVGGEGLHDWLVNSRTFKRMQGQEGGETGIDEDFAAKSMTGMGAWILGRHMFGPVRGPWPDESWRGCWGKNPPYHAP